ncbi:MAG: isochorismatase family protein [Proteobacteria bacterium]|nr:isochorismatase family protein [Pseudomonadota bacterium]MBU1685828.1 isochorismatase family protein [Pseudomonadota bacterium]
MKSNQFIQPDNTALLVVDIQERLMRVIHDREMVAKNAALLIKTASVLKLPQLATTQYAEKIGPLIPEVLAELGPIPVDDKLEFNALANPAIGQRIKSLPSSVDTLVICGVETHICIYQTVVGALSMGYDVRVVADAVSSRDKRNRKIGLARIREVGAVIVSTEMIIYELLGRAGTPHFKALLPFMK